MIRVDIIGDLGRGIAEFEVPSLHIRGKSRQPLLDACRMIKRAGGDTADECGLYRKGRSEPDLKVSSAEYGAKITVEERKKLGAPVFAKYKEFSLDG